jgi:hypothetical protein
MNKACDTLLRTWIVNNTKSYVSNACILEKLRKRKWFECQLLGYVYQIYHSLESVLLEITY